MNNRLIACLSMLLLSLCAEASNRTVKADGSGNFTTIQACANAMSNGDTCTVYAGTYNEEITIKAGAVGAYKTLQANGSDLVYVLDVTLNSHNKLIGFHVQNPAAPHSHDCIVVNGNATDVYVTGNTTYACGGNHGAIAGGTGSSYVYLQDNTVVWPCTTSTPPTAPCIAINFVGDHWLIENNDISHVSDFIYLTGNYNVIRNNLLHDTKESDCIASCHIDGVQTGSAIATQYNLVEGNTIVNSLGPNEHFTILQAYQCAGQCHNIIYRFNKGAHVGSAAVEDDNGKIATAPGFYNISVYNNTFADFSQTGGGTAAFIYNATNAAFMNNLLYYPGTFAVNAFLCDDRSAGASTCSTFTAKNNLAWCTNCKLYGQVYQKGSFTDVTSASTGNIKADPLFVSYSPTVLGDLSLSPASPAVGAGSYLTKVAATDSGSGTSLVVNDAGFFQDGHGIQGVKPDQIRVGTTTVVQITSVNYTNNTLSLAKPITRSPGDPIYLFSDSNGRVVLFGNAPDIGALPTAVQQTPAPPTGLAVTVS